MLFTPFYLPLVGIAMLLMFTFLSGLPTKYKLLLIASVYLLTVFIPTVLIFLYRLARGWSLQEYSRRCGSSWESLRSCCKTISNSTSKDAHSSCWASSSS